MTTYYLPDRTVDCDGLTYEPAIFNKADAIGAIRVVTCGQVYRKLAGGWVYRGMEHYPGKGQN